MSIREHLPAIFWSTALLLLGLTLALFLVFRTLFTDGPSDIWDPEYLLAHALTLAAYFACSAVVMLWGLPPAAAYLTPLLVPGLAILLVYTDVRTGLRLATMGAVVIGTVGGALLGRWVRKRRAEPTSTTAQG